MDLTCHTAMPAKTRRPIRMRTAVSPFHGWSSGST